ncbi:hypothetical protein A2Z00_03115 [Candidatus Gottesmanbacteria bacterium RBG_13_45_10]|uniref:EamA domain-containing protein n=1 Tax=Candidatus Gottesmanbacteria bacterium RBG_13_45_10 TaxID=1798370 RepID=A0A1F5ZG90_9BACT|nr:MAG: hypothetical protein A2Z00_03115 [Candidatus Gottesmanbacteria bacterium RBG_13_45_10]
MKLTTAQKAVGAIIIANIIWGAAPAIFKLSLQNIPVFTLAFWRFFLGALILLAILRKRAKLPTSSRRDLFLLIAYSLTGITINIIFFFWGLKLTYSINAPIIASAQPILTFILALLFLHELFSLRKLTGMILGAIGIIVIVLEPLLHTGIDGSLLGNIFLVIATVAAVIQTIIGKDVLNRFEPIAFTFWSFIIGAASFLPMASYELVKNPHIYQSLDIRGFGGLTFGAILSSAVAYTLFAWGLSKITATDASVFSYVDPIIGTVLGYFLLKEPITGFFALGSALIFGGIFLAEKRIHYHPLHLLRNTETPPSPDTPPPTQNTSPPRPHVNKKEALARIFGQRH